MDSPTKPETLACEAMKLHDSISRFISLHEVLSTVTNTENVTYQEAARALLHLLNGFPQNRPLWHRYTYSDGVMQDDSLGVEYGPELLRLSQITGEPVERRGHDFEYGYDPFTSPSTKAHKFIVFGPALGFLRSEMSEFLTAHGIRGFAQQTDVPVAAVDVAESGAALDAAEVEGKSRGLQHLVIRRKDQLAAVLKTSEHRAHDASDWTSVWAALVFLASSAERPPPLLGYVEGEGVKYQQDIAGKPDGWLTRDAFRKRFARKKKN